MIGSYLVTLLGVCGLAVGVLVILRAAKGAGLSVGDAQLIRVIGRQAVGTGATIMLVEVDGQRLLIGVSRNAIVALNDMRDVPSNVVAIENGFRATLRRAGDRW